MSEIDKAEAPPLDEVALLRSYRAGTGSRDGQLQLGIETERWFVQRADARDGRLRMMSATDSQRVLRRLAERPGARAVYELHGQRLAKPTPGAPLVLVDIGDANFQLELCGVIEICTAPSPALAVTEQIRRLRAAHEALQLVTDAEGLVALQWAVPGSITPAMCEPNRVERERLRAEWAKFQGEGADHPGLRTMGLAASTQASISHRDAQEAAEIITLGNLLCPILYAAFGNTPGYIEGTASATMPRPMWWQQHRTRAPRAGIPTPILRRMFHPDAPGDMLGDWVAYVKSVPMVYHLDAHGEPRFDTSPSFDELAALGLGTTINYALAESLVWPDVKVIGGHRIELRMCDAGPWQGEALAVLAAGLLARPDVRRDAIAALKSFNQLSADGLQRSLTAVAREHVDAPYGNRRIRDQLPWLLELIVDARTHLGIPAESTARLEEILRTGESDFVIARRTLHGMDAVTADLTGLVVSAPAPRTPPSSAARGTSPTR